MTGAWSSSRSTRLPITVPARLSTSPRRVVAQEGLVDERRRPARVQVLVAEAVAVGIRVQRSKDNRLQGEGAEFAHGQAAAQVRQALNLQRHAPSREPGAIGPSVVRTSRSA